MSDKELERIRMEKAKMYIKIHSMPKDIIEIHTIDDFNKLLKNFPDKIIIIDFWATWCAPCMVFSPIFKRLQQEYLNDFIFIKVNVDENQILANSYRITGIPTTLLIKNGKILNKIVGATTYNKMKIILEELNRNFENIHK
ncbi:MAG: thioredoxin family protein [Promethearchaeota archaeon]